MAEIVSALTYPDLDRDVPPREVKGELVTRVVETLGYTQYLVGGVPVDPATIRRDAGAAPAGDNTEISHI